MNILSKLEMSYGPSIVLFLYAFFQIRQNVHEKCGLGMGGKDYRLRITSEFQSAEDPLDVVIFDDGVKRIFLRDIARSQLGWEKEKVSVMQNNSDAIVVGVHKEHGANVLDLLDNMRQVVSELNQGILKENGIHLDGFDKIIDNLIIIIYTHRVRF